LHAACYDFLARPIELRSQIAIDVRELLRVGNLQGIDQLVDMSHEEERRALYEGPEAWITSKLLNRLLSSFRQSIPGSAA
jgi:hypothetical protein